MLNRLALVLVACLAIVFAGMIGGAMERRGWPHDLITLVVCLLIAAVAYGVITIGPTL